MHAAQEQARRIVTRRSGIHGKGVFATTFISAGTRLIEYKGERISDAKSERRYPDTAHTFLFMLEHQQVIDGGRNGNTSRWINHSCEPNCETSCAERIGKKYHNKILRVSLY